MSELPYLAPKCLLFGHGGTALAQGSYCFLNYALIKHNPTACLGIFNFASSALANEAALIAADGFWPTLRMKELKYFETITNYASPTITSSIDFYQSNEF
jgi:hypothetical protein